EHLCLCLNRNEAAYSVHSPPPCGEGLGVGVVVWGNVSASPHHPLPNPPPQGGREQTEFAARADSISHEYARLRCVSCFTLGRADALYGWRRHRAIGDGGRSPTARPSWAFPPSTGPRWLPPAGPFSMSASLPIPAVL